MAYNFTEIEEKWQKYWDENKTWEYSLPTAFSAYKKYCKQSSASKQQFDRAEQSARKRLLVVDFFLFKISRQKSLFILPKPHRALEFVGDGIGHAYNELVIISQ